MSTTVQAPSGAHFDYDEVKTQKGQVSLGEVPILVWDNLDAARSYYGDQGLVDILDGTSLRVSFQSIARRLKAAGKTEDDIAKAQVDFRPGRRVVGAATPTSRAKASAVKAAEKIDGDVLAALMQKIASGELSEDDVRSLAGA